MSKRDVMPLLPLVGLSAYFVTSIFYVFPSGTPQPADYLLLATIAVTILFAWRRLPSDRDLYAAVGLFIIWIMLVNVTWFFLTNEFRFLIVIFFYAFNMLVFLFVIAVANHDFRRLRTSIWWSCASALLLQIALLYFFPLDQATRAIGTFNNPNQLGYWALIVMASLAVIKHRTSLGVWDVAALSVGLYAIVLSQSRAALISSLLLVALVIYYLRFERMAKRAAAAVLSVALIVGLAGGGVITTVTESTPVANLLSRFEGRDEIEEVKGRGYDRIINHPQYLIFGSGEGENDRFTESDKAKELHSSIGNLLFSYGLIGLALFCLLIFVALRSAPWPSIAYFGPVMLYGVAHMGLRFSLFWVLLGLIYSQGRDRLHRTSQKHGVGRHWTKTPAASGMRSLPAGASGAVLAGRSNKTSDAKGIQRASALYEQRGASAAPKQRSSPHSRKGSPRRRGPSSRGVPR